MKLIRAGLFQLCFYLWGAAVVLAFLPAFLLPRQATILGMRLFAAGTIFLMRRVAGIKLEVRGAEHRPAGAAIVAAKHQSTFDTIVYHALLRDPAIVMKRELLWIPLYGLYALRAGMIPVDRSGGPSAVRDLVRRARRAAAGSREILIFPQGTRVAPGAAMPYQSGLAALYVQMQLPVVPVATNSGVCWPRRSFAKHPGTIVVEFLPAIPAGLRRREFAARIETAIETASDRLLAGNSGTFPKPEGG